MQSNYDCKQFICWVADSPLCCTLIKTCGMHIISSSSQPHSLSYPTFMFNSGTQSIAAPGNRNTQPVLYLKIWYQSRPLVCGVSLDLKAKVNAKAANAHLQIVITTLFEAAIFTLIRSANREVQMLGGRSTARETCWNREDYVGVRFKVQSLNSNRRNTNLLIRAAERVVQMH